MKAKYNSWVLKYLILYALKYWTCLSIKNIFFKKWQDLPVFLYLFMWSTPFLMNCEHSPVSRLLCAKHECLIMVLKLLTITQSVFQSLSPFWRYFTFYGWLILLIVWRLYMGTEAWAYLSDTLQLCFAKYRELKCFGSYSYHYFSVSWSKLWQC